MMARIFMRPFRGGAALYDDRQAVDTLAISVAPRRTSGSNIPPYRRKERQSFSRLGAMRDPHLREPVLSGVGVSK